MKAFLASVWFLAAVVATTGCVRRVVERDTTVTPSATVVTTTPGTTVVTVTAPPPVIACGGAYAPIGGTNFGACPERQKEIRPVVLVSRKEVTEAGAGDPARSVVPLDAGPTC